MEKKTKKTKKEVAPKSKEEAQNPIEVAETKAESIAVAVMEKTEEEKDDLEILLDNIKEESAKAKEEKVTKTRERVESHKSLTTEEVDKILANIFAGEKIRADLIYAKNQSEKIILTAVDGAEVYDDKDKSAIVLKLDGISKIDEDLWQNALAYVFGYSPYIMKALGLRELFRNEMDDVISEKSYPVIRDGDTVEFLYDGEGLLITSEALQLFVRNVIFAGLIRGIVTKTKKKKCQDRYDSNPTFAVNFLSLGRAKVKKGTMYEGLI